MTTDDEKQPTEAATAATGEFPAAQTDPLQVVTNERDALQQKWLLAVADFDNYRKRLLKEIEQERRYAPLPLARDMLPVIDNLHRALEAAKTSSDAQQLVQGVQMVVKQFDDVLTRHGIMPINAAGKPFDPNLHQALQQVPTADQPPMTVMAEYERGYTMHDRVVRPSTVIVSAPIDKAEK